jgi:hypothetical protein
LPYTWLAIGYYTHSLRSQAFAAAAAAAGSQTSRRLCMRYCTRYEHFCFVDNCVWVPACDCLLPSIDDATAALSVLLCDRSLR